MSSKKTRRSRPEPRGTTDEESGRGRAQGGYPGLEGDFESERRRAASASHENVEPYEHGEGEVPVLPATEPGLTHP